MFEIWYLDLSGNKLVISHRRDATNIQHVGDCEEPTDLQLFTETAIFMFKARAPASIYCAIGWPFGFKMM